MIKFNGLGAVLEWKYGLVANTKQFGDEMRITAWRHKTIPQPDEAQLEQDFIEYNAYLVSIAYIEKRQKEYPDVGTQLGAITDVLKHLKTEGTNIGTIGDDLVTQIETIKAKYPKPQGSGI